MSPTQALPKLRLPRRTYGDILSTTSSNDPRRRRPPASPFRSLSTATWGFELSKVRREFSILRRGAMSFSPASSPKRSVPRPLRRSSRAELLARRRLSSIRLSRLALSTLTVHIRASSRRRSRRRASRPRSATLKESSSRTEVSTSRFACQLNLLRSLVRASCSPAPSSAH